MPPFDQTRRVSVFGAALYALPLAVFALMFTAISAVQQRSLIEAAKAEWIELSAAAAVITLIWIPVAWLINRRRRRAAAPPEPTRAIEHKIEPASPPTRSASPPPDAKPARPAPAPAKSETYTPHIEENASRRLTVDYIPMLERALSQLKTSDAAARESVYDHARDLLVRNLRKMRPVLTQAEVLQEKLALEEAIGRIEKSLEAEEGAAS